MNRSFRLGMFAVTSSVCFLALQASLIQSAHAQTPAETLEKGIYNEETTGNLDAAIKHYRQVIADSEKTASLAAQAQYRLARCLDKQGKKDEANEAFRLLIKNYPNQKELIEKAREFVPSQPKLLPAPWKSGERLTLTMLIGNTKPIGMIGTAVRSGDLDGEKVWDMGVRRHVAGSANSGVSQVVIDQATNLPIETKWRHTLLGTCSATWSKNSVEITKLTKDGKEETKTVTFDQPSYCNDQWMFGFRQLPMEIGTKTSVPLRVAFTGGNPVVMEIEVAAKEKVDTPVGSFECFRLDTNIAQTFWITDTPERYIAQFDAGGVRAVLTSVEYDQPETISNDKLGFSIVKPAGWYHFEPKSDNKNTSGGTVLIAPNALVSAILKVRDKTLLDSDEQGSVSEWVDKMIARGKQQYEDAAVREGSQVETMLADQPGSEFVIDYTSAGNKMSAKTAVAFKDSKAIEYVFAGRHRTSIRIKSRWGRFATPSR